MSILYKSGNIYGVGTTVFAKATPNVKLVIMHYYRRIYYCSPADDLNAKPLVYFEDELTIEPGSKADLEANISNT